MLFPEIIDPDSGASRPWQEGETGELVLTHLIKQAQPLIRFRTGDIITLTGVDKAECGRTAPRFRVVGRSDDMVVIRGINVFPSMLTGIVNSTGALSGEYRIQLDQPPPYDFLPLEVELANMTGDSEKLEAGLKNQITQQIGVSARVRVLPPMSLPRTAGKTKRVVKSF
ncbi:MAG: hypothetical protein P8Y12_07560 [Gammaproteobacteria bacterium]